MTEKSRALGDCQWREEMGTQELPLSGMLLWVLQNAHLQGCQFWHHDNYTALFVAIHWCFIERNHCKDRGKRRVLGTQGSPLLHGHSLPAAPTSSCSLRLVLFSQEVAAITTQLFAALCEFQQQPVLEKQWKYPTFLLPRRLGAVEIPYLILSTLLLASPLRQEDLKESSKEKPVPAQSRSMWRPAEQKGTVLPWKKTF